jgi:hypothetical protein
MMSDTTNVAWLVAAWTRERSTIEAIHGLYVQAKNAKENGTAAYQAEDYIAAAQLIDGATSYDEGACVQAREMLDAIDALRKALEPTPEPEPVELNERPGYVSEWPSYEGRNIG